jgi:hypothetical protein
MRSGTTRSRRGHVRASLNFPAAPAPSAPARAVLKPQRSLWVLLTRPSNSSKAKPANAPIYSRPAPRCGANIGERNVAAGREQRGEHARAPDEARAPRVGQLAVAIGNPLGNLLSNAVKYTPRGERVEVRLIGGNGHVLVEVQNTGSQVIELAQIDEEEPEDIERHRTAARKGN